MNTVRGPIISYRRYWLPEAVVLALLTLVTVVLFAITDLDLVTVRPFYHPELSVPWPVSNDPLWLLFYRSAPWITGSLAVAGVALLITGVVREKSRRLRLYGIFILLSVIIGPGLIINLALKDHWGRARPRQLVEFGGSSEYSQPLAPFQASGKSFPCGHCSVGYLYGIGWWVWRRSHPRRAVVSLAAGLAVGTLLGIGRMTDGGHYLSDAFWSALIALGIAHVLYYYVLRIPAREDSRSVLYPLLRQSPRLKATVIAFSVLIGAGIIGGGLLANPHYADLTAHIRLADFPSEPHILEVTADTLDVELSLVSVPPGEIESSGAVHGFGLPNSDFSVAWTFEERPLPTLHYRVVPDGLFTDIDGIARIRVPVQDLAKIIVRVKHGDITVIDTRRDAQGGKRPTLDLHTSDGRVWGDS
ncbi:MAG TPA: phosphatase PAP2 family protein [Nitrospirota bacterium]|nr:phosphatase PAP2 family protein [Nitrospirota bacterium]